MVNIVRTLFGFNKPVKIENVERRVRPNNFRDSITQRLDKLEKRLESSEEE
tara:strand:+ start:305 stop:457 length:153 start_codon:yes stop_codon:yes gene_type:complete